MSNEARFPVNLTEKEINGLIAQISLIRIADVHPCRIKAVHSGFEELKAIQAEIRIQGEIDSESLAE